MAVLAKPRALGRGEVHVWNVALDDGGTGRGETTGMLAPTERDKAARFISEVARDRFVQRRCALREILAGYLGVEPRDLAFGANEFGKPSITAPSTGVGLCFNAAHSETVTAIAVARCGRIGIDIERLRPLADAERIAARYFAPGEAAALAALAPPDRVAGFFNAWTRKEALVKALGAGLSIPLDSFEVSLRPGEPPVILRWNIPGEDPQRWRIHQFDAVAGHVAALAVDFRVSTRHCWQWGAERATMPS